MMILIWLMQRLRIWVERRMNKMIKEPEENTTVEEPKPVETFKEEDVKLIIPLATYRKIMAYTAICDLEISGFAEVEYNKERNAFIAGEVYLMKQEVSPSTTELEEEDISKFNFEYIKAGGTQLPRLWWHSHVNMEAFFSPTDEGTLTDLQNETFMIALVVNKRKQMKAKAYVYEEKTTLSSIMGIDFEESTKEWIEIDPLHVTVELEYERIPEVLKKEVEEKVKKKIWPIHEPKQLHSGKNKKKGRKNTSAGIISPLQLPKDPDAAEKRILELGLERKWDWTSGDWVYEDPTTGQKWVDYWETLEKFDNSYNGEDERN